MSFERVQVGKLEYLRSTLIDAPHCFSTRYGGVSEGYLDSLNLGVHRGDLPERYLENYRILGEAVGFRPEDVAFSRQIHSDQVIRVGPEYRNRVLEPDREETERDGMVTNEPGIALAVFGADCTTILLYDPVKVAIAAVHSGWRGTAMGIVRRAVERMTAEYGSDPADIRAAIGPCICADCFETHRDVPDAMLASLGVDALPAIRTGAREGKFHVDLKLLNRIWLERAGVTQIDVTEDCTACQPARYWSHRVTQGHRGSQAAIITL